MKCEKPIPRALAQSSTAEHSAPDCDTKAILPAGAFSGATEALSPMPGTSSPMELAPSTRIPELRTTSRTASSAVRPSAPIEWASAEVMMQAARVPLAASAAITAATVAAGEHTSAESGTSGRLATSG